MTPQELSRFLSAALVRFGAEAPVDLMAVQLTKNGSRFRISTKDSFGALPNFELADGGHVYYFIPGGERMPPERRDAFYIHSCHTTTR